MLRWIGRWIGRLLHWGEDAEFIASLFGVGDYVAAALVSTGLVAWWRWLSEVPAPLLVALWLFVFLVVIALIALIRWLIDRFSHEKLKEPAALSVGPLSGVAEGAPSLDRIPLTELLKLAADLGWDFASKDSLHLLDMQDAIRQGGLDSTLMIWGKPKKWSDEGLMRKEVLHEIPPEHWKEFMVVLFPAIYGGDNFYIKSWSPNEKLQGHMDLHVERVEAATWLKRDAVSFRGKTKM